MDHADKIQTELVRLVNGKRVLRLSYPPLALALEKKVDPKLSVANQKKRLFGIFEAALVQAELNAD